MTDASRYASCIEENWVKWDQFIYIYHYSAWQNSRRETVHWKTFFFHFLSTAKLKCCLDPNKKIPITKQFNKIALHHFCIQRQRQERWNIVEREFLGQQKGKVINFQFFFSFLWHLATLPTIRVSASLLLIQSVPQLSSHFVSIILSASTHPNCKSWGSFDKFRKFATW